MDDYRIVQCIEDNKNAWHAGDGNGTGNRRTLAVEICYSTAVDGELFSKSEKLAAKFIAYKLKQKGKGIESVRKHQDFSGKYCPHRTLDLGWERFLNLIRVELGEEVIKTETPIKPNAKIDVKYQAYADKWYPDVINTTDHAGTKGKAISGFRGNTVGPEKEAGKLIYCVGLLNGRWLGEITDREKDKSGDDFAGILGKPIDRIMVRASKGDRKSVV